MDNPKRIYFKLPEERIDCKRLKMVCLQLSDGTEMWFETTKTYTTLMGKLADALKRAEKAEARLVDIIELVNEQAEDEGLWFQNETAPEDYLQRALRKLHAEIERE